MAKKLTEEEKNLLENFKKGMAKESGADGYRAFKKSSGALGKYQFVPYWHLDDMVAYAKENEKILGKIDMPTKAEWMKNRETWTEEEMKDYFEPILSNQTLQDGFYKSQTAKLIPIATEQYNKWGKKLGWSLEGFMALNHFKGTGSTEKSKGSEYILNQANGDKNAKILNTEVDKDNPINITRYVKGFETEITAKGGTLGKDEEYTKEAKGDNPDLGKKLDELLVRKKTIMTDTDMEPEDKATAMGLVYEDVKKYGLEDAYGVMMNNYNIKKEREIKEFETGTSAGGYIHSLVQNSENAFTVDDKGTFKISLKPEELKKLEGKIDPNLYKDLTNQMNKGVRATSRGSQQHKRGTSVVELTGRATRLLEVPDKEYRNLTDKNLYLDATGSLELDENGQPKFLYLDANQKPIPVIADFSNVKLDITPDFTKVRDVKEEKRVKDAEDAAKAEADSNKEIDDLNKDETTTEDGVDQKGIDKRIEDYFGNLTEKITQDMPDVFDYQSGDFKKELPLDALAQGGLALIGMADAKTELPLRDEQVSEAIIQFMNTQKKLSQMGLKPEQEAEMKNQISEVYQSSVNALTRASNGNRNIVLGGINQANETRLKGLSTIALADIKAKDDAYEKYGKTLEYIENFNTTRDNANHKIKYDEAVAKRTAGAALAASGFAGMLDELKYQKENGPGSANHMLKQQSMFRIFGVVPGMEDRGQVGSVSYHKKMKAGVDASDNAKNVSNALNENVKNKWAGLSQVEKNAYMEQGFDTKVTTDAAKKNWLETGIMATSQKGVANAWNPSPKTSLNQSVSGGLVQAEVGGYKAPTEPNKLPTDQTNPWALDSNTAEQYLRAKTGIFEPVLPGMDNLNKLTYQ